MTATSAAITKRNILTSNSESRAAHDAPRTRRSSLAETGARGAERRALDGRHAAARMKNGTTIGSSCRFDVAALQPAREADQRAIGSARKWRA
ncbi:MAG: hypothetical protein V4801_10605 [Burkholderia gladioli]